MGLMSLMGDDDEYPLITGSQGALSATGRTFMRDKIPPYSIRIGGTYYSYKRLDPFATSLALIADGIANYQSLKNMYHARKNHKLDEWKDFCKEIEKLPYINFLICFFAFYYKNLWFFII